MIREFMYVSTLKGAEPGMYYDRDGDVWRLGSKTVQNWITGAKWRMPPPDVWKHRDIVSIDDVEFTYGPYLRIKLWNAFEYDKTEYPKEWIKTNYEI